MNLACAVLLCVILAIMAEEVAELEATALEKAIPANISSRAQKKGKIKPKNVTVEHTEIVTRILDGNMPKGRMIVIQKAIGEAFDNEFSDHKRTQILAKEMKQRLTKAKWVVAVNPGGIFLKDAKRFTYIEVEHDEILRSYVWAACFSCP
ncbi:hypothetical protein Trydic_g3660 [Trypoxylus dichotomus]